MDAHRIEDYQVKRIEHAAWSDEKVTEVKLKINNLVWMYAPDDTTLLEADLIACEMLNMLKELKSNEDS